MTDPLLEALAEACRRHPTAEKRVLLENPARGRILGERLAREGVSWLNLRFDTPKSLALEAAAGEMARLGLKPLHPAAGPPWSAGEIGRAHV